MSSFFFGITDRVFTYDHTIGRAEFSGSGFRQPMDMAISSEGIIYVPSRCWEYRPDGVRVTMVTPDEDFVGEFSKFGDGDGDMVWPTSIALDKDDNVYLADEALNRISIFDKDGGFLDKWGVPGSDEGQLNKPSGIRFDADENMLMVDSANHRVQKFTKDGKFLAAWGSQGTGPGQFNLPWGLTIDQNGDVYVCDWRNDRVQKFSPDGEYLAEFGAPHTEMSEADSQQYVLSVQIGVDKVFSDEPRQAMPPGQFDRPTGVAVDKYGDVYVCDWRTDRVEVLSPDGRYITSLTGEAGLSKWGHEKLNANPDHLKMRKLVRDLVMERKLWRPKAILIDDGGRIYILDTNRARIQVYQKEDY